MTDLAKLVVRLEAQSAQYQAELEKANRKLETFGKKTDSSLKNISKSVGAAALTAAAGLTALGASSINALDEVSKLSQKTGVSTEVLSQLGYAASLSGSSLEGIQKAFLKLSRSAVDATEGLKESKEAFEAIGITSKDVAEGLSSPDELLLKIADKFASFEDGAGKAALAMRLFGKSGGELIPLLNGGREGIEKLLREADKLGVTMSGPAAAAAEVFNDNISRLVVSFKGVANQAIQRLLPSLAAFSDEVVAGATKSDDFNRSVDQMVAGFKALATVAIVVKSILNAVGTSIGALAAALPDLLEGINAADFATPGLAIVKMGVNVSKTNGVLDKLKGTFEDIGSSAAGDIEKLSKLWGEGKESVEEVRITVKKLKAELKFSDPKILEGIEKAAAASLKKLKDLSTELTQQVKTFGLGETAALNYSLVFGSLSDDVARLGTAGTVLAGSITATSLELEKLKNSDALASMEIQVLELTGRFNEAAAAAFDLQNKALKGSLQTTGDAAGLEKLETLRKLTLAQAEFEQLQVEAQKVQEKLAQTEQRIQNARIAGAATELQATTQTSAARQNTVKELEAILQKQEEIAAAAGNPKLVEDVERFKVEIESLSAQTDLLAQSIRGGVEQSFGAAFADLITGAATAEEAIMSFLKNVQRQFADLIAQNFAQQLFGGLGGTTTSGGGGGGAGFWGSIASAFAGSMDSGGHGKKGSAYAIGTGAQPELFIPGTSGRFIPKQEWMGSGTTIQQTFAIQAPQGTVSRQTQLQTGAEAARGIQLAQRRNNR